MSGDLKPKLISEKKAQNKQAGTMMHSIVKNRADTECTGKSARKMDRMNKACKREDRLAEIEERISKWNPPWAYTNVS